MNFEPSLEQRIRDLLRRRKLKLLVPGEKAAANYRRYFDDEPGVSLFNYRFSLDERYRHRVTDDDFDTIRFHLTGTANDGRKGHMLVLSAFQELLCRHQVDGPGYRPFEVHMVGLGIRLPLPADRGARQAGAGEPVPPSAEGHTRPRR